MRSGNPRRIWIPSLTENPKGDILLAVKEGTMNEQELSQYVENKTRTVEDFDRPQS